MRAIAFSNFRRSLTPPSALGCSLTMLPLKRSPRWCAPALLARLDFAKRGPRKWCPPSIGFLCWRMAHWLSQVTSRRMMESLKPASRSVVAACPRTNPIAIIPTSRAVLKRRVSRSQRARPPAKNVAAASRPSAFQMGRSRSKAITRSPAGRA